MDIDTLRQISAGYDINEMRAAIGISTEGTEVRTKAFFKKTVQPLLCQCLLILIISMVASEISLRIYHALNPVFIFWGSDQSYNKYRGKPFADEWDFKLNSRGFKDTEVREKQEHTYRILGLGDSFAFGVVPYKYNYLTLLESQFQHDYPGVEVVNMGIPDTGPKEYLSILVQEGLELKPDMVLLSFFVGNDFGSSKKPMVQRLCSYSYVGTLLHYIVTVYQNSEGQVFHGSGAYCDDCPNFTTAAFLAIEQKRSFIYLENNNEFETLLHAAMAHLRHIQEICKKKGVPLVVVIIPDEVQINATLESQVRALLPPEDRSRWNRTLPNSSLAMQLKAAGINYIDLYPDFVREGQTRQLYKPRDTHWNIAGNQLAANIIARQLGAYISHRPDILKDGNSEK